MTTFKISPKKLFSLLITLFILGAQVVLFQNCGEMRTLATDGTGLGSSSRSCDLPWGGTLASGEGILAYQALSVPNGQTCISQTRSCANGALSGTYLYQSCVVGPATPVYSWQAAAWSACSAVACGTAGTQTRTVVCKDSAGATVADSLCVSAGAKPATSQACSAPACQTYTYAWEAAVWGPCSSTACGTSGTQVRGVTCKRSDGAVAADNLCTAAKPALSQACTNPACGGAIAFIFDKRIIGIPAPATYPAKGTTITDPITGFKVTRTADASELTGDSNGKTGMSLIVYPRYTPANTTGEFTVVHGENSTSAWVYRNSNNTVATILRPSLSSGASIGENHEIRWDYSPQNPYRLYFVNGKKFYSTDINPTTGAQSAPVVVHDFGVEFPSGSYIMNDVEGDSSNDSRYWAWMVMSNGGGVSAIISYDKTENKIVGGLQTSCTGATYPCVVMASIPKPNMVEMSPLGTRVHVNWGSDNGGPTAFSKDFSEKFRIAADESHAGWAWGPNGEEMLVYQNNQNDYIEAVDVKNATTANCKTSGGVTSCGIKVAYFTDLDPTWDIGMHFGKIYDQNKKGWLYANTAGTDFSNYGYNQNYLIRIKTGTPKILRLGSTYNRHTDYRSEGLGAFDFKGNTIWMSANWSITNKNNVFKLELPADWFQQLSALP